ncbi:hypothetical protein EV182_007764, partial [Spiromyces aspiralis]
DSLVKPHTAQHPNAHFAPAADPHGSMNMRKLDLTCRICRTADHISMIAVPYVFRFLATELMAMNIKLQVSVN